MQRWHSCLPSSSLPQRPTSIHMGWLLTAQGDDGSGSRPVTHGNDGGSQRFTPKESSSSYPCVTCSRPPPGFCPLLTSGTPLPSSLPSISVHLSLSPLSGPSSSNFVNLPSSLRRRRRCTRKPISREPSQLKPIFKRGGEARSAKGLGRVDLRTRGEDTLTRGEKKRSAFFP